MSCPAIKHCPQCHHLSDCNQNTATSTNEGASPRMGLQQIASPHHVRRSTSRNAGVRSSTLLLTSGVFVLAISLFQNQHLLLRVVTDISIPMHAMPGVFLPSSSPSTRASSNSARTSRVTTTTTATIPIPDRSPRHRPPADPKEETEYQGECTLLNGTQVMLSPNGKTKIPTFIIIGVHKGGTTALRELLQVHQQQHSHSEANTSSIIVPSIKREPHYFDWHYEDIMKTLHGDGSIENRGMDVDKRKRYRRGLCQVRYDYVTEHFEMEKFATSKVQSNTVYYSYEKTPSYIIAPGVAKLIKQVLPWTKVVVSLRNPMERLVSHYRMDIERQYENATLEDWLAQDLSILQRQNYTLPPVGTMPVSLRQAWDKIPPRTKKNGNVFPGNWKATSLVYRGLYADQLREWLEHYELGQDLYILPFELLKEHPKELLQDMLDFLQIPTASLSTTALLEEQSSTQNGTKPRDHRYRQSYSPNRGELKVNISAEMRDYLRRLFKPYNDDLQRQLLAGSAPVVSTRRTMKAQKDGSATSLLEMIRNWT